MKAKYANPFLSSVANVLEKVANVKPTKGDVQKGQGVQNGKLFTMFFTLNKGVAGFFSLSFDEPMAMKLIEKMQGAKPDRLDEMGISALMEFVDMVKGNALSDLSNDGVEFEASETALYDNQVVEGDSIVLTMQTEFGDLDIQFNIKK